ncbi:MAG: TonB-dependent receptor [Gammaproteobacteria bacterium]|nr:TonB-dependent receptor [Gammaproteobacteria bacterium]
MAEPTGIQLRHAAAAGALGALLAAGMAGAAEGSAGIEEIVVTAQKRTENVQDVPIAISAFTAETMQAKGLSDLTRLSALTPNVNLDGGAPFSGDSSVLSASIRGIGQDDFAFNLDPGVGVYVDGVFLARTIGANQNLLDVDRIEILKGPQGTLFGRNTIGGAINIVTHTPGDVSKVVGMMTVGQYNRRDIQLTADMPINASILTTLSASSQTQRGYQKVVPYPAGSSIALNPYTIVGQADMPRAPGTDTRSDGGGKNMQALRGKVLIHANDKLDVTISGDWTYQNQPGLANTVMGVFASNQAGYIDPNGAGAGALFGGSLMGNFYNMCITTPSGALVAGPFNSTNGLCGPLGVGTWNSATGAFRGNGLTGGVPALAGAGAVGVPNAVLNGLVAAYGGVLQPNGTYALPGGGVVTLSPGPHGGSVIYPGRTPRLYWAFPNTQTGNIDTTFSNGSNFARYNAYGGSVTFDWSLTDSMTLKSISGWRQILWDVGTDLDGTPESLQEVTDEQKQRQFSQEFQLTGKAFSDRLDYALGLYYFTESGYVHDFVPFNTAYLWVYDYRNDVKTKSYAAYAHLDYKLTEKWGVTVGGRYSIERKEFEGGQGDLNGFSYKISGCYDPAVDANTFPGFGAVPSGVTCQMLLGFPDPTNPLRYFPAGFDDQDWNVFTPTFGTQFHVNDDVMLYASYSKGFKSGGWTTRLSNPIMDSAAARFDPEYNQAYELGLKSDWFDRHLQANLALFYNKYDGIQINVQQGPSPVYQNAGDAKIKGAELELQAVMDNGLGVGLTGGYMDAYYTFLEPCLLYNAVNNVCAAANGSSYSPIWGGFTMDTKLPKTPEYKFSISPSYDTTLPGGSRLRLLADYTHTASVQNTAPNTPLLERPSTEMLNASIHWAPSGGKYEFAIGGTNLTDERYLTVGSTNPAAGEIIASYNAPRMWSASVKVKFE